MSRYFPKVMSGLVLLALLLCQPTCLAAADSPLAVTYPDLDGIGVNEFGYRLLKLALIKSGQPFQLNLTTVPMNHVRARAMLTSGEISICDFGTNPEFEREYLPIYFPVDRGLNGLRLFVIRRQDAERFKQINSLADLGHFVAGQGLDWADINVLQNAGLQVEKASTIKDLFSMVKNDRFDYLPLGFNEVYGFLKTYQTGSDDLVVDDHVLLVYPFARLFFVNRGNQALHDVVLAGLEKAFEDGSLQALFNEDSSFKAAIVEAKLKRRLVISIDNPYLTPEFMKMPKKYFMKLSDLVK